MANEETLYKVGEQMAMIFLGIDRKKKHDLEQARKIALRSEQLVKGRGLTEGSEFFDFEGDARKHVVDQPDEINYNTINSYCLKRNMLRLVGGDNELAEARRAIGLSIFGSLDDWVKRKAAQKPYDDSPVKDN